MLSGEAYNSRDPELLKLYHNARALILAYNQSDSRNIVERDWILGQLLGKKNPGVWIESPFFCDYGVNIEIGENTFINTNCMFLDNNRIKIGKMVSLLPMSRPIQLPIRSKLPRIYQDNERTGYHTLTKPVIIGTMSGSEGIR